ncbi:ribonuclease BN [Haliangium ochraceum DSM 14365]|uniref:Ribonuclease BN n=2 Tax=Haliangium ochraceum TaxID=80816 RepID=D0LIK3_HALO1|nr:ribonuclease BN [Haliangium ochraceum DSM 14365]
MGQTEESTMSEPNDDTWIDRLSILWDEEKLARRVDPYRGKPGIRALSVRQLEALILTIHSLFDEELLRRAASLTYYTLLSLVPLLAVGFALFEAFGGLSKLKEPLKELIVDTVAVGRQDEIGTWLNQFIDNVNAGAIAGVGVLVLFYSAIGLLTNIESAFNRIWGIERDRPMHMRFAIYWCIVTLAPPLLGVSISFSARLQSSSFASSVLDWLPFGLGNLVVVLSSTATVSLAFVLSFIIVPNTKVKVKYALLGGITTGVLWNVTKALYIWFIAGSVKYSAIYGALSALPLLMMWLYLSWIILLFGVTYTRVSQTYTAERLQSAPALSQMALEKLAGHLLVEIARAYHAGRGAVTTDSLAEAIGAQVTVIRPLLRKMVNHRVLIETQMGEELAFVPGRALSDLTLADAATALRCEGEDIHTVCTGEAHERVYALLKSANQAAFEHLRSHDLATLSALDAYAEARAGNGAGEGSEGDSKADAKTEAEETVQAVDTISLTH